MRCQMLVEKLRDMGLGITDPLHIFAFSYNVYVYFHTIVIIIINNIVIRLFKDLNFCQPTFLVI